MMHTSHRQPQLNAKRPSSTVGRFTAGASRLHRPGGRVVWVLVVLVGLTGCNVGFEKTPIQLDDSSSDAINDTRNDVQLTDVIDTTSACDSELVACAVSDGGDVCVDLQTNPEHCGACDIVCDGEEQCVDGMCCSLPTCDPFPLVCETVTNACGITPCGCQMPWACDGDMKCRIPDGERVYTVLDSATTYCVDGSTEPATCPTESTDSLSLQDGVSLDTVPDLEVVGETGVVVEKHNGYMYSQDLQGMGVAYTAAVTTCDGLSLAGYQDWRIPNVMELHALIDFGRVEVFDPATFNWGPSDLWVESAEDTANMHNRAISPRGHVVAVDSAAVVCVRGPRFSIQFENNGETVTHIASGLMFELTPHTAATWTEAMKACADLAKNGLDDWRLPTAKELILQLDLFDAAPPFVFETGTWFNEERIFTSTPFPGLPEITVVDFQRGTSGEEGAGAPLRFVCVRQSVP